MRTIPYCVLPLGLARTLAARVNALGAALSRRLPSLGEQLEHAELRFDAISYLSLCIVSDTALFIAFGVIIGLALDLRIGFLLSFFLTVFVFAQQLAYPRVIVLRRVSAIEKDLLSALQDMHVQISAGVPLFHVLAAIAQSRYGAVSAEFGKAVGRIGNGEEQVRVLQDLAESTPSVHFRRAVWQIANGMRTGSDLGGIMNEMIETLSEEQAIQLQRYGSQLNPLVMMYMLMGIIAPSLGVTFVVLLTSFITVSDYTLTFIFAALFCTYLFFQAVFLSMVGSRRPNLL